MKSTNLIIVVLMFFFASCSKEQMVLDEQKAENASYKEAMPYTQSGIWTAYRSKGANFVFDFYVGVHPPPTCTSLWIQAPGSTFWQGPMPISEGEITCNSKFYNRFYPFMATLASVPSDMTTLCFTATFSCANPNLSGGACAPFTLCYCDLN